MPGADVRNAAVLLRSLPSEAAAALLASLSPREVELVQAEMASAGHVSADEESGAFTAFAAASGVARHPSMIEARSFDFLDRVDRRCLVALLSEEHPQTCAVVLSQLPTESAVELLMNLPADQRPDVIERIATMGQIRCDILHDVAQALADRVARLRVERNEFFDGAIAAADILESLDQARQRTLHKSVADFGRVDRALIDRAWHTSSGEVGRATDAGNSRAVSPAAPGRRVA